MPENLEEISKALQLLEKQDRGEKNNEESCRAEEIARVEVKMLKEEGLKQAGDAGTRPA